MKVIIREQKEWSRRTFDFGWGNGYVLIPKDTRFHGKHYDDIDVDVHGGLTFSVLVDAKMVEDWELDEEDEGKWCVGFDTSHYGDNLFKWSKEKVQEETEKLKKQLLNQ
jgi:hypothetical protein